MTTYLTIIQDAIGVICNGSKNAISADVAVNSFLCDLQDVGEQIS